jgi:hypothetical protein
MEWVCEFASMQQQHPAALVLAERISLSCCLKGGAAAAMH